MAENANANKEYHNLTVFNPMILTTELNVAPNGDVRLMGTGCVCPECANITPIDIVLKETRNQSFHNFFSTDYHESQAIQKHIIDINNQMKRDPSKRLELRGNLMEYVEEHAPDSFFQDQVDASVFKCDACGWTLMSQIPFAPNITAVSEPTLCLVGHPGDDGKIHFVMPEDHVRVNKAIEMVTKKDGKIVGVSRKASFSKIRIEDGKVLTDNTRIYSQDYDLEEHKLTESVYVEDEKTHKLTKAHYQDLSDMFKNHANMYTNGYKHHKHNYAELLTSASKYTEKTPLFMPSATLSNLMKIDGRYTASQLALLTNGINGRYTRSSMSETRRVVNAYIKNDLNENLKLIAAQKANEWGFNNPILVSKGIGQYIDKTTVGVLTSERTATSPMELQLLTQMLVKYPAMYQQILKNTDKQLTDITIDKLELLKKGKIPADQIAITEKDQIFVATINIKDGLTKLSMMPDALLLKLRKANNIDEAKKLFGEMIFTSEAHTGLKYGDVSPEMLDKVKSEFERDPIVTACNMWSIATMTPKAGRTSETLKRWFDIIDPTKEFNRDRFRLTYDQKDKGQNLYVGMYEHSTFPAFSGMLQCPSGQENKLIRTYMLHHPGVDDPSGVQTFIKQVYRQGFTYKLFQKFNRQVEKYDRFIVECNGDKDVVGAMLYFTETMSDLSSYHSKETFVRNLRQVIGDKAPVVFEKCLKTRLFKAITPDNVDHIFESGRKPDVPDKNAALGYIRIRNSTISKTGGLRGFFLLDAKSDNYLHEVLSKHVADLQIPYGGYGHDAIKKALTTQIKKSTDPDVQSVPFHVDKTEPGVSSPSVPESNSGSSYDDENDNGWDRRF